MDLEWTWTGSGPELDNILPENPQISLVNQDFANPTHFVLEHYFRALDKLKPNK